MAWRGSGAAGSDRGSSGTRGSAVSVELPPQLGRYRVKQKLGGGGMGSVYLVENTELEREEALKVPHFGDGANTELLERFLREARSAAKLEHANLCPIYDAGVLDGIYYLTMRYLKGKLLSDYSGQPQPTRKVVEIVTKLALALETAHAKGVIHRDLKPSNIMMVAGVGPVVMDFGLARQVQQADTRLTQMGATLGTPAYMPPEQVNGELDQMGPASDVYSLGVIFYELLTGRLPFEGTMASIFGKILYVQAPHPSTVVPGLNTALDVICRRAMAKEATNRYPSMKAFAAVLIEFLRSVPATEGLGNLIPTDGNKVAGFQDQTVAPSPRPAAQSDIFGLQTVAPQPKASRPLPTVVARPPSSLPLPTVVVSSPSPLPLPTVVASSPATILQNGGLPQIDTSAREEGDVEDGRGSGASFGAHMVGAFYLTLVLVVCAGAGWVMLEVLKPRVQTPVLADAKSRHDNVKVLPAPMVTGVKLDFKFPDYTGVPPRFGVDGGEIDAIEKTIVTVHARTNQPVARAYLDLGRGMQPMMEVGGEDSQDLTGKIEVLTDGSYTIKFGTTGGQKNPDPVVYDIRAIKDQVPTVKIVAPKPRIKVPSNAKVAINFEAGDDHGVKVINLNVIEGSEGLVSHDILENKKPERKVSGTEILDLAKHKLKPGTQIEYWLVAYDTKTPTWNSATTEKQVIEIIAPLKSEEIAQHDEKIRKENQPPASPATVSKPVDRQAAPKAKPAPAPVRLTAPAKMEKAQQLLDQGKKKEALALYKEVVEEFPGTREFGIAERRVTTITNDLTPHRPSDMFAQADRYLLEGKKQAAINMLERIIDEFPGSKEHGQAKFKIITIRNSTTPYEPPNHGINPRG
jgi:serine/threonine protein kinase